MAIKKGMTTNFFHSSLLLLFLDPGSRMGKNQDPGSRIRDKHPGSATLLLFLESLMELASLELLGAFLRLLSFLLL